MVDLPRERKASLTDHPLPTQAMSDDVQRGVDALLALKKRPNRNLFGSPRFASRSPLGKPKKEITKEAKQKRKEIAKEAKQKRPRAPKPDIVSVDDDLALLLTKMSMPSPEDMSMSEDVSEDMST